MCGCLFDFDGAVFEFGDCAIGVKGVGREDVGGGFSKMERDEDAAEFDGVVGADGQADGSSAAAHAGGTGCGWGAQCPTISQKCTL